MAADNFVLGLVQGLATYRPMTMILNFSASIFCLLLVSKASKNPLSTIAICVFGNLLIHIAATLADVSSMKEWIVLKCILIIAPLLCIVIVLRQKTARRNERATTGNQGN